MKNDIHNKDFARSFALKQSLKWTRKWPIELYSYAIFSFVWWENTLIDHVSENTLYSGIQVIRFKLPCIGVTKCHIVLSQTQELNLPPLGWSWSCGYGNLVPRAFSSTIFQNGGSSGKSSRRRPWGRGCGLWLYQRDTLWRRHNMAWISYIDVVDSRVSVITS